MSYALVFLCILSFGLITVFRLVNRTIPSVAYDPQNLHNPFCGSRRFAMGRSDALEPFNGVVPHHYFFTYVLSLVHS
jgi:hypothetical protein